LNLSWQHLLAFLFAVGLLVTVHEFGHYWVARRLGVKVLRFSVGFGKPLFKRVAGADKTEYVIAAIPLGGYVKLLDEREAPVTRRSPRAPSIAALAAHPGAGRRVQHHLAVLLLAALFVNGVTMCAQWWAISSPSHRPGCAPATRSPHRRRVVRDQSDVVMALLDHGR
jgi:membrane-associated protease RseP (regulator of RpoE activity)